MSEYKQNPRRFGKTSESVLLFLANCEIGKKAIYHAPDYVVMSRTLYESLEQKLRVARAALANYADTDNWEDSGCSSGCKVMVDKWLIAEKALDQTK